MAQPVLERLAEVVREDGHVYLLARVSSATLDSLASFETSREDMEEDSEPSNGGGYGGYEVDAELDTSDAEPDDEREYDFPRERQKYIKDRQVPGRAHILNGRRFVDSPSYDSTRDDEELRKAKRQVNALAAKKRKRVKA